VAKSNLITGSITIPSWDQYSPFTAGGTSGSNQIYSIDNPNVLYPGLGITGGIISPGTTIVSVDYANSTAVISQNLTGTSPSNSMQVVFADGQFYIPTSTFFNINSIYYTSDIVPGFQIVNQASDFNSGIPLSGVFNLFRITKVVSRSSSSEMSFYVEFDEEAPYIDTLHSPTNGITNAITQQTTYRSYGWSVPEGIGYSFPPGSTEAQTNFAVQNNSDFVTVISGPTGPGIIFAPPACTKFGFTSGIEESLNIPFPIPVGPYNGIPIPYFKIDSFSPHACAIS
jgi:hypothetical protein